MPDSDLSSLSDDQLKALHLQSLSDDQLRTLYGASNQGKEATPGFFSKLQQLWENPPTGPSLIGAAKSAYEAFKTPGEAAAGKFSAAPEAPGMMTEEDAFRQNQAQDAMIPAAINMAGNVALRPAPMAATLPKAPTVLAARSAAQEIGPDVNAAAVQRMAKSFAADKLTPEVVAQRAAQLGPEAMALDMGRQMQGRAEAIAAQPGEGQNAVLDAVGRRVHGTDPLTGLPKEAFGEQAANRIKQTLDQQLGVSHNKVDLINGVSNVVDRQARPLYQSVMDAHPVVNVPDSITSRPAVASAMKDAVTLAKNYGEDLTSPTQTRTIVQGPGYHIAEDVNAPAQTSLRYWDYVKKSLDKRISNYMKSGGASDLSSADKADLGGLIDARNALRDHLDAVTDGEYANARRVWSFKPDLTEAYDVGRGAFGSKLLPEEFADQLKNMSAPEQVMAKAGYRRELENLIDTARNDGARARALLDTNANGDKIEALFGPQARQAVENRIDAETRFQSAANKIAANSRTQVRGQMAKDTESQSIATPPQASLLGFAHKGAMTTLDYLRNQGMEKTRSAIGRMSTMSGDELQNLAQILSQYNTERTAPGPQVAAPTSALARTLATGPILRLMTPAQPASQ